MSTYRQGMATVIADLPVHERPRERLMLRGLEALSERELLALILRQGYAGGSALDLAASLLGEHGGVLGLARARPESSPSIPGSAWQRLLPSPLRSSLLCVQATNPSRASFAAPKTWPAWFGGSWLASVASGLSSWSVTPETACVGRW